MTTGQVIVVAVTAAMVAVLVMLAVATLLRGRGKEDSRRPPVL